MPGESLAPQRKLISDQYVCTSPPYSGGYRKCIAAIIQNASFTCNTRDLYSGYPDKSHMMRYGFPFDLWVYHAADLVALFSNNKAEAAGLLLKYKIPGGNTTAKLYANLLVGSKVAQAYKTFFASFVISGGDPNTLKMPTDNGGNPPKWSIANGDGDELKNVLTVQVPSGQPGFVLGPDNQKAKKTRAFWTRIVGEVEAAAEQSVRDNRNDEL